jgi:hypothetical protein
LARFLGFQDRVGLAKWASDNPEIWGNSEGWWMFLRGSAFGRGQKFPAQVLVDHWQKVGERLKKLEDQKSWFRFLPRWLRRLIGHE